MKKVLRTLFTAIAICFSLLSFSQPIISVAPTSFSVTIANCNDSVTLPLTINNTGSSSLTFNLYDHQTTFMKLYVGNEDIDNISEFDMNTNTFTGGPVSSGDSPWRLAISPKGDRLFASNRYSNNVYVYNTSNNALITIIPVGTFPSGMCFSPDGRFCFVTNRNSNSVSKINCSTNTVVSTIVGSMNQPVDVGITPDGAILYVANKNGDNVTVHNANTGVFITTITGIMQPHDVVMHPDGRFVYIGEAAFSTDNVVVINTATNTIVTSIGTFDQVHGLDITPNGKFIYALDKWNSWVQVIQTSTNTVVDTIIDPMFNNGWDLVISPKGDYAYVTNKWNLPNFITLNLSNNTVLSSTNTSGGPNSWPAGEANLNSWATWMNESAQSGTIVASGSIIVNVEFNSLGLFGGTYTGVIYVNSNDPANPSVAIPCTMVVVGSANINIPLGSACPKFDTIMVNATDADTFNIQNLDCGILNITNVTSSNTTDFNIISYPSSIPGFSSGQLIVEFNPATIGNKTTTITVQNNNADTAFCLQGFSTPAPTITVSPSSFTVTVACGDSLLDTLVVGNTGGGNLNYALSPCNFNAPLASVLNYMNTNFTMVNSVIPSRYDFTDGIIGNSIPDGGNDMYDGGNYINTNLGTNLAYSDNVIINSAAMGAGGKYFTRKYQGLWMFAADVNNISSFYTSGNNGADGSGNVDGTILTTTRCGTSYKGFVKRVYNAGDPSINQLIIVEDKPGINHSFPAGNTDDGNHTITGLNTTTRIYFLLYASAAGGYIDNANTLNIMNKFLDAINQYPGWLIVGPPSSGTITPTGDDSIPIEFDATGFNVGTYTTTIYVNSNDPANPSVAVPCTFIITGSADARFTLMDIIPTNCLDLDSIMTLTTSKDSIRLQNVGCDTLRIDSLTISPSIFTVFSNPQKVGPGQTKYLVVQFSPVAAGSFTGTLNFYSNDADTVICLKGKAFPPPTICWDPDTFNVTLGCNDSIIQQLLICNSGGSNLTFDITGQDGFCGSSAGGNINVAVYNNATITALLNTQPDMTATTISTYNAATLANYDVLMNIRNSNLDQAAVLNWISNGGTWIGEWTSNEFPILNWGAIAGTSPNTGASGSISVNINDPAHYLAQNINWASMPVGSNPCDFMRRLTGITDPAANNIISVNHSSYGNNPLLVEKKYGQGKIILFNWDYQDAPNFNAVVQDMIQEVVRYGGSGLSWLCPDTTSGIVAINDTNIVNFEFNSTGLVVGTYTTSLSIATNDPLNNPVIIPVTLNVVGTADFDLSALGDTIAPLCLDLDSIMANTTSTDTIYIANTGCDTLFLDSLKFTPSEFSLASSGFPILPGQTKKIAVLFSPTSVGSFAGSVTIYTNDLDTAICLKGKSFPRPVLSTVPDTFNLTLNCADTIIDTLKIFNTGNQNLFYHIPYKSLELDGTGDWVTTPLNIDQSATSPGLTMEAWVYPTSTSAGNHHVFSTENGGLDWSLLRNGATWYVYTGEGNRSTGIAVTLNQWQHIAAVFIPGYGVKFYKNGVLTNILFIAYDAADNNVNIGRNPGAAGTEFPGRIDEARIWNVQRTQAQIIASMNTKLSGTQTGLLGYWNFDNGTAKDISGGNNNGTFVGNAAATRPDVLTSMPNWMSINSVADTVAFNDSSMVPVTFISTGLTIGQYNYNILIYSNDPLSNPDTVPVILNVTGVAQSEFFLADSIGACLDLDSIMEFTTSTDSIGIINTGCDTLFLDSLNFSSALFSSVSSPPYILPTDTNFVVVQFAPVAAGTYTATVTVYTNILDPVICLYGEAFARPIICYFPDTFNVTLGCNDSITLPLGICNSGGSDLIWDIEENGGSATPKVLLLCNDGNGPSVETQLVSTGLFTAADIDIINSPPSLTYAMLQPYDAVLTWTNTAFGAAIGDTLKKYVDNGGSVVLGTYAFSAPWPMNGGIMTAGYSPFTTAGTQCVSGTLNLLTLPDPTHPIFTGISVNPTYWTNCNYSNPALTAGATLLGTDMSGNRVVAENAAKNVVGLVIYPGNLSLGNASVKRLVANALYYVGSNDMTWLTLNPTADTTVAGDTTFVNVEFNSTGLVAGQYTGSLIINSNDPLSPVDTIPVTLNVVGNADFELTALGDTITPLCLDLDSIMEYTTSTDTIFIANTGCDTLFIDSMIVSPSVFSVVGSTSPILMGNNGWIAIQFAPVSTGTFNGTLNLYTNDLDTVICLFGESFARPIQCHNPNSYNLNFSICQDSIIETLDVCNTGGSNLYWDLSADDNVSATFDGTGDYINRGITNLPTGSVMTAEAWIYPVAYTTPTYNGIVSWGGRFCNGNAMVLSIQSNGRPSMATWCWDFVPGAGPTATLNQWNHIACVLNGTAVTLYMNGVPVSGVLGGIPTVDPNNLAIGSTDYPGRYFNGKIDEVRIYNRALSGAEILATMNKSLTGFETGLMGYWNFDDGTANDLSPMNNDGTFNGNATTAKPNAPVNEPWVIFNPQADTTAGGGNTNVQVIFYKDSLTPGVHNYNIYLSSNDPLNAVDTIPVTITVDSIPPNAPVANDTSVCFGNPTPSLVAIPANSSDTVKWYDFSWVLVSTNDTFATGQTAMGTYTYYVTATDTTSNCESQADTVFLFINGAPSEPIANNDSSCFGQSVPALTSTGTLNQWYTSLPPTAPVFTGDPYNTGLTAAGTYTFFVTDSTGGCPESAADTVTLKINALPNKPLAKDTAVCFGGPIPPLTATVTGTDSIRWYNTAMIFQASGDTFNHGQSAAGTYTYYVTSVDTVTNCESVRDTAILTINITAQPTANNVSSCFGSPTPPLVATPNNSIQWYDNLMNPLAANDTLITGQVAVGTYTYYVTQTMNGCPSNPLMVTLTINPIPVTPTAPDASSCFGSPTPLLTATGTNIKWYSDAALTLQVGTGSPFNTGQTAVGTYTYYVTQTAAGCPSLSDTVYLTIYALPTIPIAADTFVCFGNPVPDLLATGITGNDTVKWYNSPTLTPVLFTGNPYATGQTAVGTYTYYVTQTDTATGCRSNADMVTLTINAQPVEPTANDVTVCFGFPVPSLTSTGTINQWYTSLPPVTPVFTGDPYNTGMTAVGSYTYFVTDSTAGCSESAADTAILTINPIPATPVSVPQIDSICFGQPNPSFTAAGTNIEWWSNPATTVLVFSGSPFTPTVTVVGTYSYYVTQTSLGCKSPSDTVIFKINPVPVVNLGADVTQCGGTVTLNAGNPGANYLWSTSATTQSIIVSVSGTYSVLVTNSGGCTMTDTTNVTINPIPAAPVSVPQYDSICFGDPNPTFNAAGTNVEWWSNPTLTTLVFSGTAFTPTVTAAGSYTYYVTQSSLGCKSPSDTVNFVISFTPALAVNDTSVSFGGPPVVLSASGTNVQWYDISMNPLGTGNTYNTGQTAIGTYTYIITQTMNNCESANDTMILTIYPGAPLGVNDTVCFGQPVPDLTATGTNIQWYSDPALTTLVFSGNPFPTGQTAVGTYTYYVTQTVNFIESPSDTVTLTINPLPAAPTSANQSACFGGTIPDLAATGTNIQWYDNTPALVFTGSPFATGQTAAGTYTYTVTQTLLGCESPADTVTLTINALPATPTASNDTAICYGDPNPSFIATGSNITWYDDAMTPVGSGSPFTPVITAPGSYTFIVTQTNTVTTCESMGDTVVFDINSIAPPVAPDVAVCFGLPVPPLTATGTNIQWYDNLGNPVFSGSPFNTGQTAVGTYTYYVTQTNTVTTCSSPQDTVYLIISTQPTLAPTVQDTDACFGSVIPDLNATSGTIINWYSDAALANLVFTGNPFATGLIAAGNYTFFATDSTPGCPEGPSDTVMLVINALPATLSVNDTASCFGSAVPDLIAVGTNITWYDTGMVIVSTNDTFATGQTAVGTYTYYVTQTNTVTGCSSVADSVMLTINALPSMPSALDTAVCSAAPIPNLTATGTNVQWYNSSWTFVFTGNSYATGQTAAGTYTYYVTQIDLATGCEGAADTSVLTIMLSPPVPTANNVAICFGQPVPPLTSSGTNVNWYSDAALTNLVAAGNTFNTGQTAVGAYTYWVTDSLTGCVSSSADSATLTINTLPAKPTANNVTICYGGSSVLTSTGANVNWYSDATLINLVGTGSPFNTGITAVGTYTYYVTDFAAGCGNSVSDTAVLTINPVPLVTANTYTATIVQGNSTTLTAYNALTYTWAPPTGLNTTTGATVIATPSVTTTYTVTGTNQYGCSSSVSILVVVNPLGVNAYNEPLQDVNIYPNPAISSFTLEFNTTLETPIDIYMFNMLGEKVKVMQSDEVQGGGLMKHKYQINTSTFTEGVYNVEIVTGKGTVNRRVVVFR